MATKKISTLTAKSTGNQFASVEQGRSYVLSVNSPSGAGEIELLAAGSDQQSEPDMFSLLYEKIETAKQIPFVAVSSFVFVNVGSSDTQWLITPANFSLAVPGVSSGGGESFDPEAPQEISGDWQFTGELIRTVKASPAANDVLNKAMGDMDYLQLASPNLQTVAGDVNFQSPLGVGEPVDLNHAVSKGYSENNFVTTSTSQTITGGKTFADGGTLEVPIPTSQGMAANKQYVDTSVVTGIGQLAIKFSSPTKAEYDALETKSNSTIYFLTDQNMWAIGDKKIVTSDMPASMYLYNTTIQSAELATGSAVAVTLPEDAPEGMYEIRFISATPTGTGLSVQPSEFRVKVTSSNPPGTQLANTATALGKSNLIIYEDENGSLKKVVPSMGMLYKIPANCTVVSAQQYMYHVQGGSDKVSFSMPSIAEEVTPSSVNITFIQIA